MRNPNIAVVLSGCGHQDGAEIHESTLTLWAIHKHGADFHCFAPNIRQHHVLNHMTGEEMDEQRNVLVESARIARGKISDLKEFRAEHYDAIVLPGGFGAAKNLSDFAFKGVDCQVIDDLKEVLSAMKKAAKPIGALCIAPAILASLFHGINLTVGQDPATITVIEKLGAKHTPTEETEVVIDTDNRIVSTPCYMLDSRVDKIGEGADKLIAVLLQMIDK